VTHDLDRFLTTSTIPDTSIRLDRIQNPLGPAVKIVDAVGRFDEWWSRLSDPIGDLKRQLGARAGVGAEWIVLANGIDELHAMMTQWRQASGPIVLFSPGDLHLERWLTRHGSQVEVLPRTRDFALPVEPGKLSLPQGATTVVMSPNDPTGTITTVQETVRLSRQSSLVVIDERHAAYSPRTLLPLVREFENLILLQTFETFASLSAFPLAWAVAPPRLASEIAAFGRPSGVAEASIIAGLAAIEADVDIKAAVRQITIEKGRLFRQLRKLSMISPPYPSWSNFLLARIERGTSDFFEPRLAQRGIRVHRVEHPRLANHFRISAVSLEATYALKHALIEIALDL
jgi:histidinol-phosphate aminotransferase